MPLNKMQIFLFFFLMLGPFKIIGPFVKITKNATPAFARQIALRATIYSSIVLLIAGLMGERVLSNYGIPLPILSLSGGIILFLVALLNIIKQFEPHPENKNFEVSPTLDMAMNPLAFPAIVTPYGIAALIVFLALSPDLNSKLMVGSTLLGIMALNLIVMLLARRIFKPLALILALLGVILGVIQVALGTMIIYNQLKTLLHT
jgi:multiple antibiotic resistance protein